MARRAARIEPSEHQSQAAVIDWWRLACKGYGLPEFALMAIPNGGARHPAVGRKLKAEGVRAGIPDLFLAARRKLYFGSGGPSDYEYLPGFWIEMKRRPNKPSAEQEAVIHYLLQHGYCVGTCYSADEAIKVIKAYLRG